MLCLRLYVCDSHFCMPFVPGFRHLGTRCWNQSIFSLKLLFQLQVIPVYLVCLLSFPCLLLEEGEVLIRVEMSYSWLMAFPSPAWPS